jgi:hypothetical protein
LRDYLPLNPILIERKKIPAPTSEQRSFYPPFKVRAFESWTDHRRVIDETEHLHPIHQSTHSDTATAKERRNKQH